MATVTSRQVVDAIIANNGVYSDDPPVTKIVEYENQFTGDLAWGLVYEHDGPLRYEKAPACHNPRVIFLRT